MRGSLAEVAAAASLRSDYLQVDRMRYVPGMSSLQFLAETHVFGIVIHPWKIVGLSGSLVFGLRFLIQWIASERARKSVIPFGFWECSALGSLLMLSYFAIYQRDSVGVLSTAMPLADLSAQSLLPLQPPGSRSMRETRHGPRSRFASAPDLDLTPVGSGEDQD